MARQANAAVTLRYGGTMVLVTVCGIRAPKEGQDFFPLTVDYLERTYAGGMIPGGFFKREGRATEKEVLTSRLTDRPIRPLFPKGYKNEVQIVATVLSSDGEHDPDVLSVCGASLALTLSPIPFLGPVGCVRVGEVGGSLVINPTYSQLKESPIDLVVAGTKEGITMIESGLNEVSSERFMEVLKFGFDEIKKLVQFQEAFAEGVSQEKWDFPPEEHDPDLVEAMRKLAVPAFQEINKPKTKEERQAAIDKLTEELSSRFVDEEKGITAQSVKAILGDLEYEEVRKYILKHRVRPDGRKPDEIRPIRCEIGLLPRTHGSALFTRGQTQSLGITTLGTSKDEQMIESYEGTIYRNFMLHYNFPPFSVGEVKMMRGPGRREIGHGILAWRGLKAVLPKENEFPYTIRLVSDILESNGSSSMATICSGSMALMDAGVPIKAAVSGIAMGLIKEGDDWVVLSDIAGVEDHLGDMDFKVAGTARGITTLQMDIKLREGVAFDIVEKAMRQADEGRRHILEIMNEAIAEPRKSISVYAPRITTLRIPTEKIREVIGPGGKMIRKITQESGAKIEINDEGVASVISVNEEASKKAIDMIREITQEPEIGQVYSGVVRRVTSFGVFCEFIPGKDGLVHISELSDGYVDDIDSVVKVGDQFNVKVLEVDAQGRVSLSRKQAPDNPALVSTPRLSGTGPTPPRAPGHQGRGGGPPYRGRGGPPSGRGSYAGRDRGAPPHRGGSRMDFPRRPPRRDRYPHP